jgi:hypothetical protein
MLVDIERRHDVMVHIDDAARRGVSGLRDGPAGLDQRARSYSREAS